MKKQLLIGGFLVLAAFPAYAKDGRVNPYGRYTNSGQVNTHVGEMDTDGHLSPGELRNPYINYNRPSYYNPKHYDYYARDRYYDQRIEELRRREQYLAQKERELYRYRYDDRRYDRPWWSNW